MISGVACPLATNGWVFVSVILACRHLPFSKKLNSQNNSTNTLLGEVR